jgi:pimeloyl-ACP methyl ester carboxylesterase
VEFVRIGSLTSTVLLAVVLSLYAQRRPASAGPPQVPVFRQDWLIPSTVPGVPMHTEIIPPQGRGPFRLAVINHGSTAEARERTGVPLTKFEIVASWFVNHGYLVALPQRPGHGETGGPYLEDISSCDNPDYVAAGLGAAASIEAVVQYLTSQPFVRKSDVVLVGHSAGAWGALAAASQMRHGLRAVINFSGGLGGHSYGEANRNCAPSRLVQASAELGRSTRVPTLWLYSANDTYFDSALSEQMADAFRSGGGLAEYHLLPSLGDDGHFLMFSPDAVPLWAPVIARFLRVSDRHTQLSGSGTVNKQ